MEEVATELLRTAKTGDEFSVVDFKGERIAFSGFKDSIDELEKVLTAPHEVRTRPLLEGIRLAIDESRQAKNPHKFIVIVSDGSPDTFPHSQDEVEALAAASDASIYSVSRNYIDISASAAEAEARAMVDLLVKRTGGRHFTIGAATESRDLALRIAADLRTSYLVGFRSAASSSAGNYRQIEIRVLVPHVQFLDTRHRPGYTAPQ
jgi:Mg-chelatase subunit ChlD